jgi:hypothetical protein
MSDQKVVVQPNPGSSSAINVDVTELVRNTDQNVVERQRINIGDDAEAGPSGIATVMDGELSNRDDKTHYILLKIYEEIKELKSFIMNSLR